MDVKKRSALENRLLSKLWQKSLDNMFILKIVENDFYVVSTNDAQQESVHIEELDHLNKPLREVLPPELYDFVTPNYHRCIQSHSPIQYEESETFTSGDGSVRHWSTMLSPISDDNGIVDYIFGISRNITDLKNAKQNAEKSTLLAEKANRVKTHFLANMSHEMRTPLNGIQCAVELLKEAQSEEEKAELISIIESSTEALSRQTNDILHYAKIGKGKISLQESDYSPLELIQSVVKIMTYKAAFKSLIVNVTISEQIPDLVKGDPDRIKQVLLNLVSNAIKFTHQGSISISLELEEEKQQLHFCVIDTGIGIQESDQEKLFKPFSQVDDSTTRQFEGNGLGLVISKSLVELMQGKISLSSSLGKGTKCKFSIPYIVATRKTEIKAEQPPHDLNNISILIVEDNPTNQFVLKKILNKTTASVTFANHGKQAIELCQSNHFDLILMDWHMPILDGLETTKILRQNPIFANTPILGLTASVMKEDIKTCIAAGMNEVITKPINRDELLSTITQYSSKLSS